MKKLDLKKDAPTYSFGTKKVTSIIHNDGNTFQFEVSTSLSSGIGLHLIGVPNYETNAVLIKALTIVQELGCDVRNDKIEIDVFGWDSRWPFEALILPISLCLYSHQNDVLMDTNEFWLTGCLDWDGTLQPMNDVEQLIQYTDQTQRKIFLPTKQYQELSASLKANAVPADSIRDIITVMDRF